MMYNPAFDTFNGIYRMLNILTHFDEHDTIEVERLCIYDFFLLFPDKTYLIKLKSTETDFKKLRAQRISKISNPYNTYPHSQRLFRKLKSYQLTALNHIAACGLIDATLLLEGKVKIADAGKLQQVVAKLEPLPVQEHNIIAWLNYCFRTTPLTGSNGLKYRTQLLEYKYDGC